jgi:hypothetical protein
LGKTAASSRKTFIGMGRYEATEERRMTYYCKKCGLSYDGSNAIMFMKSSVCQHGGKCEPYQGLETGPYHCKKCGIPLRDLFSLVGRTCQRDGNKCEPYEGRQSKGPWVCKKCGRSLNDMFSLVNSTCNSGNGKCEAM